MDIKFIALEKAINTIKALGGKFKIVMPDGTEYGDYHPPVPETHETKKRTAPKYKRGLVTKHCEKYVSDTVNVGTVLEIPGGEFDVGTTRSVACNVAGRVWGRGNYVSHIKGSVVELMRIK